MKNYTKKFENFSEEDKQISFIDYLSKLLLSLDKTNIDTDDLKKISNIGNKYSIFNDGLEDLLKKVVDKKYNIEDSIKFLKKYKELYLQWRNDLDWWHYVEDYAVDGDDNSWKNYKPLYKFIKDL
jgi:hypothetical protein